MWQPRSARRRRKNCFEERLLNFDDFDYLLAVAKHANIGRAAEALGLTQSAVTRAVARLEALAGQALFVRHPKGVTPTPAGLALLRRAQRIGLEYHDAMRELHQMKSGQLGLLRVGCSPTVEEGLVIGVARRLLLERPAARLALDEALMPPLLERLAEGSLDLAVGPVPDDAAGGFKSRFLYEDQLRLVADRDHPLFTLPKVTWTELGAQGWMLPPPPNRLRLRLEQAAVEAGCPPLDVRVETRSPGLSHFRLLKGTRMVSLCNQWLAPAARRAGLEVLDSDLLGLSRRIAVVRRAGGYLSPLAERLEELMVGEAARLAGG